MPVDCRASEVFAEDSPFALPPLQRIGIFSRGLDRLPGLARLLGAEEVVLNPGAYAAGRLDAVAGWGQKASAQRAERYARRHKLPLLRLEDGFLRSVGLGVHGAPPLSVVVDPVGIYYDTSRPSLLSELLNANGPHDLLDDRALLKRAAECMRRIAAANLTKYNGAPDAPAVLGRGTFAAQVLVVDQTRGDLSVVHGGGSERAFAEMLQAAIDENPSAEILVKIHPDVLAGKKQGYLGRVSMHARVTILADDVNARSLVARVDRVYAVTSQLGFEALLAGKPVTLFGRPFYAGWGLTDDRVPTGHARRTRTLEQLFAAAFLLYARYRDPVTGAAATAETVIEHLALQRRCLQANAGNIYCHGFQFWKQTFVRRFLAAPGNRVQFIRSPAEARRKGFGAGSRLVVWGHRGKASIAALAAEHGVAIERMEDGFIRSAGLGSDFIAPLSLVLDRSGIYYDPSRPSDLEQLIAAAPVDASLVRRAADLRQRMVAGGVSKYNFAHQTVLARSAPPGKAVVLVPGQVEDDISIRLGCPGPSTNRALLEAVRAACPDAYVIFKPHPEVLSGNRKGRVTLRPGEWLWDELATEASVASCLAVADEVHTLTSLVGFEALLREKRVVTYGQPFYAGWGLTLDKSPLARREAYARRPTLDDLVACTLILYPRYLDSESLAFATPEATLDAVQAAAQRSRLGRRLHQPWAVRQLLKMFRLMAGVGYAR